MRRVCGDDPAQNTPGNYVADKIIIRRHKAHEHRSTKNGAYDSTAGVAINHTIAKPKILAAWPDGKLPMSSPR